MSIEIGDRVRAQLGKCFPAMVSRPNDVGEFGVVVDKLDVQGSRQVLVKFDNGLKHRCYERHLVNVCGKNYDIEKIKEKVYESVFGGVCINRKVPEDAKWFADDMKIKKDGSVFKVFFKVLDRWVCCKLLKETVLQGYKYCGVLYKTKGAARREAVYEWCKNYGDSLGEQAKYIENHTDRCVEDMARQWKIPFCEDGDIERCKKLLLDFVDEQGVI